MNRKWLLIVVALASVGAAQAQSSASQLNFTGSVVQSGCVPAAPIAGMHGGWGSCGAGATRSVYAESVNPAQHATGVAMLDYFAARPDGGSKYVVTREYR